jgi:hypothetical protein
MLVLPSLSARLDTVLLPFLLAATVVIVVAATAKVSAIKQGTR